MDPMNSRAANVVWTDADNCDSYLLCAPAYGLKILQATPIDADTTKITVYGDNENVDRFLECVEEDSVEPLESMSISLEFDEDYEGWLDNEVAYFKQLAGFED